MNNIIPITIGIDATNPRTQEFLTNILPGLITSHGVTILPDAAPPAPPAPPFDPMAAIAALRGGAPVTFVNAPVVNGGTQVPATSRAKVSKRSGGPGWPFKDVIVNGEARRCYMTDKGSRPQDVVYGRAIVPGDARHMVTVTPPNGTRFTVFIHEGDVAAWYAQAEQARTAWAIGQRNARITSGVVKA